MDDESTPGHVTTDRREGNDEDAAFWRDLDEIAREINRFWPKGVSAEEAIDDVRREL